MGMLECHSVLECLDLLQFEINQSAMFLDTNAHARVFMEIHERTAHFFCLFFFQSLFSVGHF